MLANFFGKSKPVNFVVLFALFFTFFTFSSFSKGFSFETVKELFWFITLFSVFNFIIVKNKITFDNSYAFFFYIILIGFFSETINIDTTFYANLTILLFLRKVYSLQTSKKTLHKLFDGGLWLGISFIIEPLTVVFAFLLYASTYLHQRYTYQTILTPLIGFFSPVFLYFTYYFWYDKTEVFYQLFNWNIDYNFEIYLSENYLIPIIFIGFCTVFSLFLKTPKTLAIKNKFRKNWILILIHLISATFLIAFFNERRINELLFIFFPTAIILTNGLELIKKKFIVDIILIFFIIFSFVSFFL